MEFPLGRMSLDQSLLRVVLAWQLARHGTLFCLQLPPSKGDATLLSSLRAGLLREAVWDAAERVEPHPGARSGCL
jgi:hypothetical protein